MLIPKLPNLPIRFQASHLLSKFKNCRCRIRLLGPRELFSCLVQLVGGANHEGYSIALVKALGEQANRVLPGKSALCRTRQKVCASFFGRILRRLIRRFHAHRLTWLGLRLYAIDGQMLILPRTPEIIQAGFSGRAISQYRDSHYPRAFWTHAYDVLSGVTRDFVIGPRLHEHADAYTMIRSFEGNSLTLYDRLYFSLKLVRAHYARHNYFLFRCRENASKSIQDFFRSGDRTRTVQFGRGPSSCEVHLIRVKQPKIKGQFSVFATNLHPAFLKPRLIYRLYRLRWEVETSFLELTGITKAEQWHSKSVNGILQEFYTRLWLINFTKIQALRFRKIPKNPLADEYQKPNFKLLYCFLVHRFFAITRRISGVWKQFEELTKKSTEKRWHGKRSYPRELRCPASPYPYNNTKWYWEA